MQRTTKPVRAVSAWGRLSAFIALLAAACAIAALPAAPATAAGRCHQLSALTGVASYGGTASMSYSSGTVTGPPGAVEFVETASVSHSASNLQIAKVKPETNEIGQSFSAHGQPTGGTVQIDSTYSDNLGGESHQTYEGPAAPPSNGVEIEIDSSKCTYQLLVSFYVQTNTTHSALGAPPDDPGVEDDATTPVTPIPANLALKGSAALPPSGSGGNAGSAGLYDISGDPGWSTVVETALGTGGTPGTASVSWNLKPVMAKKPKHHEHHGKHGRG